MQYLMLRAMFLPGKVTPEQQAFYVDLFQKVTQTAEYKDYMEKQALKPNLPHRQGHGPIPRGGRHAEQIPDDRGRICCQVERPRPPAAPRAEWKAAQTCSR